MEKIKIIIILTFAILSAFLVTCSDNTPVAEEEPTLSEKFQRVLDEGIVKYKGKGISVAIIMPDGLIWKGSSGISHETEFVTTDMLFSAGSITKTFTSTTIMLLAEEGKLKLDDSLHKWLPIFDNIDSTITIRHLLNHTSGIYNVTDHPDIWNEILISNPNKTWDIEEMITQELIDESTLATWNADETNWLDSLSADYLTE